MKLTYEAIARRIDHALLAPAMTHAELVAGCQIAALYEVATVCIKPYAVPQAVDELLGTKVGVGTVVGFPHGANSTSMKIAEAIDAIDAGATEIDLVVNIGAVRSGQWALVETEISAVRLVSRERQALLKVIFETCYLDDLQKVELCRLCGRVEVDYVKTSTGYGTNGATVADITLLRRESPPEVRVKASGNIKNLDTAIVFSELGAERLGLSRTAEVLDELCDRLALPRRSVPRETDEMASNKGEY